MWADTMRGMDVGEDILRGRGRYAERQGNLCLLNPVL